MLGLVDRLPTLGPLESFAILRLGVAIRDAYSTYMLQVLYLLIDMHYILLYVKFEDGLSISVLKNNAIRHNSLQLEIIRFLKKSNVFAHFISHPDCGL
jgi:hypothetical protein